MLRQFLGSATDVGVGVLNAMAPSSQYRLLRDFVYHDAEGLRLDVYTPRGEVEGAPVVVFFSVTTVVIACVLVFVLCGLCYAYSGPSVIVVSAFAFFCPVSSVSPA